MTNIQYVVDHSGNKVSVILPFSEWEQLNSQYEKLKKKLEVLQGIQESMNEIRYAKNKEIQ